MLFTSYAFFAFFAITLIAYYLIPKKFQWTLLLLASYFFFFSASPDCLVYLIVTTVTVYFSALKIAKSHEEQAAWIAEHKTGITREEKLLYKAKKKKVRARYVVVCVLINIAILCVLKYSGFFLANVNGIMSLFGKRIEVSFSTLAIPLGISFYTLQAIGYLVDVYRQAVPAEKNPFKFALFLSFFPQLIQGPISRSNDLASQLYRQHPFDVKALTRGTQRMLWGYFKKLVVADRILPAIAVITGDPGTYRGGYVFAAMIMYSIQLYADFTGGIDITIGIAESFGIKIKENFIRPYFSKSLKEYWRRWHISMGTWFRDYLFYPVASCKWMQKISRACRKHLKGKAGRRVPLYISTFIVWLATGLWHGAGWNFIVWGLLNWLILMVSEELEQLYDRFHKRFPASNTAFYRLFQVARTFLLISCLKLFDCYDTLTETSRAFRSVFINPGHIVLNGFFSRLGLSYADCAVLAAGILLMLAVSLVQRNGSVRDKIAKLPYPARFLIWFGLFLIVLLTGTYGMGYDANQFIYNRF